MTLLTEPPTEELRALSFQAKIEEEKTKQAQEKTKQAKAQPKIDHGGVLSNNVFCSLTMCFALRVLPPAHYPCFLFLQS